MSHERLEPPVLLTDSVLKRKGDKVSFSTPISFTKLLLWEGGDGQHSLLIYLLF